MPPYGDHITSRVQWIPEIGYVLRSGLEQKGYLENDYRATGLCAHEVRGFPRGSLRKPLVCFISFGKGEITHLSRGEVRYPAQSGSDRLDLWNLVELASPIRISVLAAKLGKTRTGRAKDALKNGGHLPPAALKQVLDALQRLDAAAYDELNGLIDRSEATPPPENTPARTNWAYQRDAVATSLEIASIPLSQLKVAPQLPSETPADAISIFDGVGDMLTIEDVLVLRDLDGDPDWRELKKHRYPAKTFENGDIKLTVVLANKLELERQLGVDLIYVNETFKSVVFVQYKMFKGANGEEGYRPDKQLDLEIERMNAAMAILTGMDADSTCEGYRIGPDPFFLKFCSKLLQHSQEGHVPGHYIPLSYWSRLAKDPRLKGPKGGVVVRIDNLGRSFTPTVFKDLVVRGWIGTTVLAFDIVVPVIAAAMAGDRSVVLAVQSVKPVDDDKEPRSRLVPPPRPRHPGRKRPPLVL